MPTSKERSTLTEAEVKILLESECSQNGTDKIKILIVEDDHSTQLLYDKGFPDQIFDKKMAVSGKEAILVYYEWHPDIIVLDIYLPEMTGFQVLKEIRATFEDKKTTIVMATSLSGSEDVLSCMKLGVEGYIIKPFQLQEIGAKILSYYAKKEPERAMKADVLYRETLKQSRIRWLLDKDKSKTEENKEGVSDITPDKEPGVAGVEKETGDTLAEKPND